MQAVDLLTSTNPPALHIVEMSADSFGNLASALAAGDPCAVVRTIRGRKSRTVAAFFDESAAALQFPPYFGENWNAFDEMIVDLDWLAGDAYLLLVTDAELLLVEAAAEDFRILAETWSRARMEWLTPNQYIPRRYANEHASLSPRGPRAGRGAQCGRPASGDHHGRGGNVLRLGVRRRRHGLRDRRERRRDLLLVQRHRRPRRGGLGLVVQDGG